MCLAVPVRVVALLDNQWIETDVGGIRSRTSIALIDDAQGFFAKRFDVVRMSAAYCFKALYGGA